MKERYTIRKEKKKRRNFANQEKRKKILRYCVQNKKFITLGKKQAFLCAQQLYNLHAKRKYDASNTKNLCLISGRGKSIYRKFGLSRHFLKKMILAGEIGGFRKSS